MDGLRKELKRFQTAVLPAELNNLSDGDVRNHVCQLRIQNGSLNAVSTMIADYVPPKQRLLSFDE